jgi:tRNA(Ile2) C34 agmatinyltransferase TiaS
MTTAYKCPVCGKVMEWMGTWFACVDCNVALITPHEEDKIEI